MKKYQVLYADPPWQCQRTKGRGIAADHYPVMRMEEFCRLPVGELADSDAALFLWVTFPQLETGLQLIRAWQFTYKTAAFVWVKTNKKSGTPFWGLGSWTRSNAEICLLAVRGHLKRISKSVHQIILPIERHGKKPDQVRERIVLLMGDAPRIEFFVRERVSGWDAWGNEVTSDVDFLEDVENE